jgi:hypothetical protein
LKKSIKDLYRIEPISYTKAQELVKKNHYLHAKAPYKIAFGLISNDTNEIEGVIIYGRGPSGSVFNSICGKEEAKNVIELTRLWVKDGLPKNCESYLIGNTLHKTGYDIIVSFADSSQNHIGTVYQATNWIYLGLTKAVLEYKLKGVVTHQYKWFKGYSIKELKEFYGDDLYLAPRSRKHRYVYFTSRRRYLLKKLKFPILTYPKKKA